MMLRVVPFLLAGSIFGQGIEGNLLYQPASSYFGDHHQERTGGNDSLLRRALNDQKTIWTSPVRIKKQQLVWMAPLAAATGLLIATDHHTTTLIHSGPAARSRASNISNVGLAAFGGTALALYGTGLYTHNKHAAEAGFITGEAMGNAAVVAEVLKLITQRERPDVHSARGDFWRSPSVLNSSFPSQHAAMAWAAAAVIAREYPGPVTQWGAYGLATAVTMSRIVGTQHFPSEALVGAAAGYLIGRYLYRTHHDNTLDDRTGSTPVDESASAFAPSASSQHTGRIQYRGPVFVPLDNWVYPALQRLAALGYVPSQNSLIAPWAREECSRQVAEAEDIASQKSARAGAATNEEALGLIRKLKEEFPANFGEGLTIQVESLYTRFMGISGAPLRDSFHFGQTLVNDYGRPYDQGFNNSSGFSAYATYGRFSAYIRGEYDYAPGRGPYSQSVRDYIGAVDQNPIQGTQPVAATNDFHPVEMYAGVELGKFDFTFGEQDLAWGPGQLVGGMSFSNNAQPFYMLRASQSRPFILPGPLKLLGKIHTDFVVGKLSGHQWPPRPYINAQKITLDLTDDLQIGFERLAIFGGVGHPLTFRSIWTSVFGLTSRQDTGYGDPHDPGDRRSSFDFRWRVPGLRRYVTIYSDSLSDDDPNPLANPHRAAWAPGIYISQFPGLRKLDFRFETASTWLYRKDYGGDFIYWNGQYHDSHTNKGNLLGSWIGRDARTYTASSTYWFTAATTIKGTFRQTKVGNEFLPNGGTQTDGMLAGQWQATPQWLLAPFVQYERYWIPVLGKAREDVVAGMQITFYPKDWQIKAHGKATP